MTASSLPQWQVVLRWDDGARSTVRYTGRLWVGAMSQGVHQLAVACYAQRQAREPGLPEHMPYLILSFTPLQLDTASALPMISGCRPDECVCSVKAC
ncbi:hypothetical protein E7T06_20325 [Deinococcus sp. Arct2-2]|uniref:hypothetical protein n=1 Tax=Deinococcus sp. Arct2-2 TaxID=2568653 RepID=UPI0010A467C8|nr:hypothetical protein [Deinococcus sp. Arct2-2]THF66810.1 hypothetical protein E7T06_20325 [Deinococcus sp. Arct2-2]